MLLRQSLHVKGRFSCLTPGRDPRASIVSLRRVPAVRHHWCKPHLQVDAGPLTALRGFRILLA
eukprot:4813266-Amphidinium_carterae.1